ncbi:unnamed protein product [Schistosoma mattheei]|uniref:Uncharacterized protein n=1 Tax=Schistosoma mattheei TaxID=31246 RepID=A0AA85B2D0_9TREM|nr:unnamed protein product [Schistosoma mattheei]
MKLNSFIYLFTHVDHNQEVDHLGVDDFVTTLFPNVRSETDNFEWELSKENIKPLKSGRSVELLNKVLTSQRSNEFQLRRRLLRE